jgi:lambda repressor-like predicted transcriptional regulator
MVGGVARARSPRELAADPDAWPDANLAGQHDGEDRRDGALIAAAAVQDIARHLAAAIADQGWSLRRLSLAAGVNRQAIADLLAGRSWPDVATVARLDHATGQHLWPDTNRGRDRLRDRRRPAGH